MASVFITFLLARAFMVRFGLFMFVDVSASVDPDVVFAVDDFVCANIYIISAFLCHIRTNNEIYRVTGTEIISRFSLSKLHFNCEVYNSHVRS